MIVNDLKPELPEEWESMFKRTSLYHPEYYEVAEFMVDGRRKALVLNRKTMDLMEYYYDDLPSDTWIDVAWFFLTETDRRKKIPSEEGVRFLNPWLNMEGEFICTSMNGNRKINVYSKLGKNNLGNDYSRFSVSIDKQDYSFFVHRFIGKIFIPNQRPEEYNVINHIDSSPTNFRPDNLEWVDSSINCLKENRDYTKSRPTRKYQHISSDGKILFETTSYKEFIKYAPGHHKYTNKNRLYKGGYLKSINLLLEHYLNNHPLVKDGWYLNKFITSHKVEANLNGVLRINDKLTIGSVRGYYLTTSIGEERGIKIHRLVWETIAGTRIPEGMVIDHIEPVREGAWEINNEFSNLRLTDSTGNNNNPETRKLKSKPICKYSLTGKLEEKYESKSEAMINKGIKSLLMHYLTVDGSIYCYTYEELEEKLRYIYYRFSEDGEIVTAGRSFRSILLDKSQRCSLRKYLNTGMPAPDGFYYQQGSPGTMLKDPGNTELKRLREILVWSKREK